MTLEMLDHDLTSAESGWAAAVYAAFAAAPGADPRERLRAVLGRAEHALAVPMDLTGNGVWRGGRNAEGRGVAAVFLKGIELHRHPFSRTDQFAMYATGPAEAFSVENGAAVLVPFAGGAHFHNPPGAPHAFLPKPGVPVAEDWEVAFLAITPRNLKDDTVEVDAATKALFRAATGLEG
jgi:hypothetical protein